MTNIIIEELDKQLEEIKNRKLFVEELFKHRSFYNFRAASTTSADIEIPCFEEKNIIENKLLNINFNKINFKLFIHFSKKDINFEYEIIFNEPSLDFLKRYSFNSISFNLSNNDPINAVNYINNFIINVTNNIKKLNLNQDDLKHLFNKASNENKKHYKNTDIYILDKYINSTNLNYNNLKEYLLKISQKYDFMAMYRFIRLILYNDEDVKITLKLKNFLPSKNEEQKNEE